MTLTAVPACPGCGEAVPPPADACFVCGTVALMGSGEEGVFGVDIGPIISRNFRAEAVAALEGAQILTVPAATLEPALVRGRTRLVEGLPEPDAALVATTLDPKKTGALVVRGGRPRAGAKGAFKNGTPLFGLGLGAVLGLAWHPIGWAIGAAVAVGLGVVNARAQQPIVGSLPPRPWLPHGGDGLGRRIVSAAAGLSASDRAAVLEAGRAIYAVLTRLADDDDIHGAIAGGLEGPLAEDAVALLRRLAAAAAVAAPGGAAARAEPLVPQARALLARLTQDDEAAQLSAWDDEAAVSVMASEDAVFEHEPG